MPYLTKQEIEQIGARVVSAYSRLSVFSGQQVQRIEPEVLLRELLGLKVLYCNIASKEEILGLTAMGNVVIGIYDDDGQFCYKSIDGKTVVINKSLLEDGKKGHLNFTLMHEISHQIFKMLFPKEYAYEEARGQIHYCKRNSVRKRVDWEEWRSDALAAAILMPPALIKEYLVRFGFGERIRMLNRVYAKDEYHRFTLMADALGVSKTALAIRLRELGLIEHDYFANPYDLVNIYTDEDWEE